MRQATLAQTLGINILSKEDTSSLLDIKVLATSPVFEGHFPENPILPGVLMVEAVRSSLNQLFHQEYYLKSALSIKFLAVVNPDEHPEVQLKINHTTAQEGLRIDAVLFYGEKIFFKMKGVYSQD